MLCIPERRGNECAHKISYFLNKIFTVSYNIHFLTITYCNHLLSEYPKSINISVSKINQAMASVDLSSYRDQHFKVIVSDKMFIFHV